MAKPVRKPGESDAAYQKRVAAWEATQGNGLGIPDFNPDAAPAGPSSSSKFPTGGFSLTGVAPQPGLRSPDAIDRPGANVLTITTSVPADTLPAEQMAVLQSQLHQAGLVPSEYKPSGNLDEQTKKALLALKQEASASGVSDLDALRTRISTRAAAEAGLIPGTDGTSTGGPSRSVSKQIVEPVFTDALTARATVRDAMKQRLGREPTADEYHQFRNLLSNSEAGQDVTTQVTTSDGQGHSTTRVKRSDTTTDPSATDLADDMLSKGRLGREANTVTAANFFDILARRVGGQ